MNKIQGGINATNLAGDAQQTADSLNQAALDAVELQRELNRLQEHLKKVVVEDSVSDADRTVIQKIIETIESINGGATDIEKAISSINQIAMGFSGDSQTDTINTQVSAVWVADCNQQIIVGYDAGSHHLFTGNHKYAGNVYDKPGSTVR